MNQTSLFTTDLFSVVRSAINIPGQNSQYKTGQHDLGTLFCQIFPEDIIFFALKCISLSRDMKLCETGL